MFNRLPLQKHWLLYGFAFGAIISLVFFVLSFILPSLITSNYYGRSLGLLRKQAQTIKKEFSDLQAEILAKEKMLFSSPFPDSEEEIFHLFQSLRLDSGTEGVAYYVRNDELRFWLGNVLDFNPSSEESSYLVRSKASVYLICPRRIRQDEFVVFSKLLAFIPQIKAPYLEEYHFLPGKLRKNARIDYWDFREDVSGFERTYARYKDEYIGQPRLQSQIQTISFPLRNEKKQIVATVNLSSASLQSSISALKDTMTLVFTLLLTASLLLLVSYLARSYLLDKEKRLTHFILLIPALVGLRLIFFPLSRLERIQSSRIFSPAQASFLSTGALTQSPADIFLTALFLLLIIGSFTIWALPYFKRTKAKGARLLNLSLQFILIAASFFFIYIFRATLSRFVFNSNINLPRLILDVPSLLLHLGILCFFLSISFCIFLSFRIIRQLSRTLWEPLILLLVGLVVFILVSGEAWSPLVLLYQTLFLGFLLLLAHEPSFLKRREVIFSGLLLSTLFISTCLQVDSSVRLRSLIQNFLPETIISQENWADFLLRQSIPEVEKRSETLLNFLHNPDSSPFARTVWENTLLSKFNWYSTFEITNNQGETLSRFSLNIPQIYRPEIILPFSPSWTISRQSLPSLGREKEFILGYKDWFSQDQHLGRTTFYLALDPEMLPFLYSANPYFELFKVSSLPSLNQVEFGFAIYDAKGKLIFNPQKVASGIRPDQAGLIQETLGPVWSTFEDKGKRYSAFYFRHKNKIYSLFTPRQDFLDYSVAFLKLLFFYILLTILIVFLPQILFGQKKFKNLFWSFSNRFYAAFIAITLAFFLLFSFFSRDFYRRVFSQRFIEKAEIQASFTRNIMQDFIFIQQEERTTLTAPSDDFVLWISSAIANDVHLYREGQLVSSSRREFFDWGLLPELIDGEIYYKIRHENKPFYIQRQNIGSFSFQSLTIPYSISQALFLISLPLPFEQEEIAEATEELVEFLVFISVFFIVLVFLFTRGMGQMVITPMRKLLAGTREVSLGNLEISVEHKSRDEMKILIDGFNSMIQNLKKHQQEIADLSKKVAWAEMAQKVAHEVKNPLTPIQLSAEHLLRVYEDKKGNFEQALKESVSYITGEVENLRRIAQEFLALSKDTGLKIERFDLKEAIQETIGPYKKMLTPRITFLEIYEGKSFPFEGDRSKIKIAIRNIFINAIEAIRGKGKIEVRLAGAEDQWILQIKDTGIGMDREVLEKIFNPYFSTKDVGTGLGLPIARKIVEDHRGSIQVESKIQRGTDITLILPKPEP